jgi:hypothetical protein
VQGLAFVGGEIVTNDGILSLGIQAEWIARVLAVRSFILSYKKLLVLSTQQHLVVNTITFLCFG